MVKLHDRGEGNLLADLCDEGYHRSCHSENLLDRIGMVRMVSVIKPVKRIFSMQGDLKSANILTTNRYFLPQARSAPPQTSMTLFVY